MSDVKIGLEVHVELSTETKMFCRCKRGEECCPVCRGEPGAKPMPNRKAVEYAIMACKALNANIAEKLRFDRKSYFYPDLPKNFQITQYDYPLGKDGRIDVNGKTISIDRISIEEDPAKISYPLSPRASKFSIIDYSRSGSPLMEIVTPPVIESPEEARMFLKAISNLFSYLGIYDAENCVMKCDANISVRETGFVKVEIKNITGFKDVEKALRYEIIRQRKVGAVEETRGWDGRVTYSMRRKEGEEDYGYIPEPNLPPVSLKNIVESVSIPELPWEREERFVREYGVSEDDAKVICSSYKLSEMFERIARKFPGRGRGVGHWLRKELLKVLNYTGNDIDEVDASRLEKILDMLFSERISDTAAKHLMKRIFEADPVDEAKKMGFLEQGIDKELIRKVVEENRKAVDDYLSGNEKAIHFLVGKVMRERPGWDSRKVLEEIRKMIEGS